MFLRCLVAGTLNAVLVRLFNGPLAMVNDAVFPWWRDVTTCTDVALFLVLFVLARRAPEYIRPLRLTVVAAACCVTGSALFCLAALQGSAVLMAAGAVLSSPANVWGIIVWLLACSTLGTRAACVCLAASGIVSPLLSIVGDMLVSPVALNAINGVCVCLSLLLCLAPSRPLLDRLGSMEAPHRRRAACPDAFLPLSHTFYVFIFVFAVTYGFALRIEGDLGGAASVVPIAAVQLAVLAYALRSREVPKVDVLFLASLALVVVGLLLALLDDARLNMFSSAFVLAGYAAFELLMWLALLAAAARNALDAVPKLCWGLAVEYVGIFAGVLLWLVPNEFLGGQVPSKELLQGAIVVAVLIVLVFLALLTRRSFDFDATIAGIAPDSPAVEVRLVDELAALCDVAVQRFGLTSREADVMRMLAHGHNTVRVQKQLGIGTNTVKFHAKNVYAKMGVHSQQELIDLVRGLRDG